MTYLFNPKIMNTKRMKELQGFKKKELISKVVGLESQVRKLRRGAEGARDYMDRMAAENVYLKSRTLWERITDKQLSL